MSYPPDPNNPYSQQPPAPGYGYPQQAPPPAPGYGYPQQAPPPAPGYGAPGRYGIPPQPGPYGNAAQVQQFYAGWGSRVAAYIVDNARATRQSPSRSLGVSPRGATALLRAARAWAWLSGRDFVTPDDVKALAQAALVHRLGLRPEAELEGVDVAQVLASAIASVPVPR